jgi:hypothetical protein
MKRLSIISILILAGLSFYGQDSKIIELKDLQMPTSPAFILLDVAPSTIERPTTTKAFTTSILSAINENNGIPENYAIDFAPYWYLKHQNLTAQNYWGIKQSNEGTKQTILSQIRFSNISLATAKSNIEADTLGLTKSLYNVAVGLRTTLIQIRNKEDVKELTKLNLKHVTRLSAMMQDPTIKPKDLINIITADTLLMKYNDSIKEIIQRKPVFAIDFAASGAWSFENNNYSSIKSNRFGGWLTLNFSKPLGYKKENKKNFINIYGIARYLNDNYYLNENGELSTASNFDGGGKFELEFDKLSISYEYMYRVNFISETDNTYRSSGMIRYRASDQILITAAFGKNFGEKNNLITQIGVNWGLNSKNQMVEIK